MFFYYFYAKPGNLCLAFALSFQVARVSFLELGRGKFTPKNYGHVKKLLPCIPRLDANGMNKLP